MEYNEWILSTFVSVSRKLAALELEKPLEAVRDVVFVCPEHPAAWLMMGAMAHFCKKHPAVTLHVVAVQVSGKGPTGGTKVVSTNTLSRERVNRSRQPCKWAFLACCCAGSRYFSERRSAK